MTFANEIAKESSRRYALVRLTPSRYIGGSLSFVSGTTYQMSFTSPIARIERNGVALTKVTSLSASDQWTHDEATGLLQVRLDSAPDDTSNVVVASYYLFLSSSYGDAAYQTPTDDSTPLREWQPRLRSAPELTQTIENITAGILTVSSFQLAVINSDGWVNQFLSDEDSFCHKAVEVWTVAGEFIEKSYVGRTLAVTLSTDDIAYFEVYDDLAKLGSIAQMGDAISSTYSSNTRLQKHAGRPVPFVFGRSKYGLSSVAVEPVREDPVVPGPGIVTVSGQHLDYQAIEMASYTGFYETPSHTANRGPWKIARTSSHGFKTLDFGTVSGVSVVRSDSAGYDEYYLYRGVPYAFMVISTAGHNLEVGDSFRWTHTSLNGGANQYAVVMSVSSTSILCILKSRTTVTANVNLGTTGLNLQTNQAPALILRLADGTGDYDGVVILCYQVDFTYTVSTLASGNKVMEVTLVNGFEVANNIDAFPYHQAIPAAIDPAKDEIFFRITQDPTGATHGVVVQEILEKAGIEVDATSITAAEAAYEASCAFTMPFAGDGSYESYRYYLELVLRSTLAYVKMDASTGQATYELLEAPSTADVDVDSNVYLSDFAIEVDYRDVVTELYTHNPHVPSSDTTATNYKAKYLHGIDNRVEIVHVLDLPDTSRFDPETSGILGNRRSLYRFGVSSLLLDKVVGDNVDVTSSKLLGSASSRTLKIVGVTKSADVVTIEATDLLGL